MSEIQKGLGLNAAHSLVVIARRPLPEWVAGEKQAWRDMRESETLLWSKLTVDAERDLAFLVGENKTLCLQKRLRNLSAQ